ncbi:MAG TPA: NTP transferase domain-containing protein [Frankiaceae bacterium]|nr:NTP transferase domain-containing protein [Frankiaceae bacterium]
MLAAVVLAAGRGKRLRPLTDLRPKPLCPVDNVPLLDRNLDQALAATPYVAVNACHLAEQVVAHAGARAHVSVEPPGSGLGTGGALGYLKPWLDGRPVLVLNGDAYRPDGLGALLDGWDRERVRLLVVRDAERGDFGDWRYAGASLHPWAAVRDLPAEPLGLYEGVWRSVEPELVPYDGTFVDCGNVTDYLRANMHASGGRSVVGDGAVVEGELVRSVVWAGAVVRRDERLVDAVRAGAEITVRG